MRPPQTLVTYAPPGYLLFVRDKTLVAQPFDAEGPEDDRRAGSARRARRNGQRRTRALLGLARRDARVPDRASGGTGSSGWTAPARRARSSATRATTTTRLLSPGGDRLAFDLADPRSAKTDVWIRDLKRGVSSRFTFGADGAFCPLWSPDGRRMAYSAGDDLVRESGRGAGAETPLFKSDETKVADRLEPRRPDPSSSTASGRRRGGTSGSCPCPGTGSRSRS